MKRYIIRRLFYAVPITLFLSFLCFVVVEIAPGDFVTNYESAIRSSTDIPEQDKAGMLLQVAELRSFYGLDRPLLVRYLVWMRNIISKGDFGYSYQIMRPVHTLIMEKLAATLLLSLTGLILGLLAAFTMGVYSATHQYSIADYVINAVVFVGMATPGFFLALVFMVIMVFGFNQQVGGLFSTEYIRAPWSLGKVVDLLKHLAVPLAVGLVTGAGGGMRIIRGNLLDALHQPYVQTARAKGLHERVVVYRHALRNSLHPWVMGMGGVFSDMISGDTIMSIVLGLPTVGLMFYTALVKEDSYVAGTFLLITTMLLQAGNLLADIALAWLDPTIRYD